MTWCAHVDDKGRWTEIKDETLIETSFLYLHVVTIVLLIAAAGQSLWAKLCCLRLLARRRAPKPRPQPRREDEAETVTAVARRRRRKHPVIISEPPPAVLTPESLVEDIRAPDPPANVAPECNDEICTEQAPILAADEICDIATCIVCMDRTRDTLLPCRHISTCEECTKMISACPLCRVAFDSHMRVFLS